MDSRLVFRGNRMICNKGTKWKYWSLKWFFNACVLRAPHQHTKLSIEAHLGANTFPTISAFFCFLPRASFVGPFASRRHLFSDHDNGRLRSGQRERFPWLSRGPDCTLSRLHLLELRPAGDWRLFLRTIPTLD